MEPSCICIYLLTPNIYMTIIMTMNIYITRDNEDKLRQLDGLTMSGLINHLLIEYFKKNSVAKLKKEVELGIQAMAIENPAAAEVIRHPEDFEVVDDHYQEKATPVDLFPDKMPLKTCKEGHLLGKNGKCLQKGCKYA